MVNELKTADFTAEVIENKKPVLVDFWAAWCGPCRMLSPIVENVSDHFSGKVDFFKVNVDEEPALAQEFGIMSIPTLIVFKDGRIVGQTLGVRSEAEIKSMLEGVI